MASPQELFAELTRVVQARFPKFTHRWKAETWIEVLIAAIVMLFNRSYLTGFITTIPPHVDWPEQDPSADPESWEILAHEYVHLCDFYRNPLWFLAQYFFPQNLALLSLFALLASVSKWFLLALVFLLALLPWPAPGRERLEMRGYTMSVAVEYWTTNTIREDTSDWITPYFTQWFYYRMWPNEADVRAILARQFQSIRDGSILLPPENTPFRDVHAMIQRLGG